MNRKHAPSNYPQRTLCAQWFPEYSFTALAHNSVRQTTNSIRWKYVPARTYHPLKITKAVKEVDCKRCSRLLRWYPYVAQALEMTEV